MTEQSWCMKCGRKMRYNIPRLGSDGGFVHDDSGYFSCDAESVEIFNAAVEAEVQRRIAEMVDEPAGGLDSFGYFMPHGSTLDRHYPIKLYLAPPQAQLQAAIDKAREEAADKLAALKKRAYVRNEFSATSAYTTAKQEIRALTGKPLGDSHDNG